MRKFLNILFIFCFGFFSPFGQWGAFAQNPLVKMWDKRFGGTSNEWLSSFVQTNDGGYIIGGTTYSGIGGDKTQASRGGLDYWMIKFCDTSSYLPIASLLASNPLCPGSSTDFINHSTYANGDYNVIATDANGCEVEAAIFNVLAGEFTCLK